MMRKSVVVEFNGGIVSSLMIFMWGSLTNPNLRCGEIIEEHTSDEQIMKVFSKLELSKQSSNVLEVSRLGVASGMMVLVNFNSLKTL